MFKVLHLNTYSWGGAAKASIRLHESLLKNGVQSKILFLEQSDYNIPESYCFRAYLAGQKIFKKIYQKGKEKYIIYQQFQKLKSINGDPNHFKFSYSPYTVELHPLFLWADIIHLHWVSNFINPATFFQKVKQSIFWTFHDIQAISGGYHYESDVNQKLYKNLLIYNQAINNKSFANEKIHVICPSKWMLDNTKAKAVLKKAEFFHLPNGIDTAVFSPLNQQMSRKLLNLPTGKKIILFVAGDLFNPRKGFRYLLDAFSKLENGNHQLICVGNKYQNRLPKEVHYLGNIDDERLMRVVYAAADVTVIPSLEDNLPNTALESILCGTPLLANPVGGLVEIVNNQNGLLCNTQDVEDFSNKLKTVLKTEFDQVLIYQNAEKYYSGLRQVQQLIPLYEKSLTDA